MVSNQVQQFNWSLVSNQEQQPTKNELLLPFITVPLCFFLLIKSCSGSSNMSCTFFCLSYAKKRLAHSQYLLKGDRMGLKQVLVVGNAFFYVSFLIIINNKHRQLHQRQQRQRINIKTIATYWVKEKTTYSNWC